MKYFVPMESVYGAAGRLRCIAVLFALFFAWMVSPANAATEISTCGVHEAEGSIVITQDLDCTNEGFQLELGINNKIDFAGHTVLTGDFPNHGSIKCRGRFELNESRTRGRCTVKDGTFHGGIRAEGRFAKVRGINLIGGLVYGMKVFVKDSTIDAGQAAPGTGSCFGGSCTVQNFQRKVGRMKVVNSTVLGGRCGIGSVNSIRLKDSEVRGSTGCGVVTQQDIDESPAKISRTVIADHDELGVRAFGSVGIKNTEITGNLGGGIDAGGGVGDGGNAKISKSIVDNNGPTGIKATLEAFISDTPVTNHTVFGVDADDVTVTGPSIITGNGTDPECGLTIPCADIHSQTLPSFTNAATCDTSLQAGSGIPGVSWGVCALD